MAIAKPFRLLLLALALPAGPSAAGSYLLPDRAPAGREFKLYLRLSEPCMSCAYSFSRESVSVEGSRIDLRYAISIPNAAIPPPAETGPIRITAGTAPAFAMPALKAGRYDVWASQVPSCLLGQPACAMPMPAPVHVGVLEADAGNPADWILNPSAGPADQAFDLQLLGPGYSCATAFDSLAVAAAGDSVTLTFFDWERPMGCALAYALYGPSFRIPALPQGVYRVKVNRLSKGTIADAGTLRIGSDPSRPGWYLKEPVVAASTPFRMQLLRDDVGNCQTSFSNQTATLSAQGILAAFVMEYRPEIVCIQDLRPHGPVFEMAGLAPGLYPVLPLEMMPCEVSVPACQVKRTAPVATDTLVAAQTLSLPLPEWRRRAARLAWNGDRLSFVLPEGGAGTWRAEWLDLQGRLRFETRFLGVPGKTVSLAIGNRAAGLGLLRLIAPEGGSHSFPVEAPVRSGNPGSSDE